MDKVRPSNHIQCLRWECPKCHYRVAFLPKDLELTCPRCSKVKAKDFIELGWGPLYEEETP